MPLSVIVCGLLDAVSVKVTHPERVPLAVGVNVTLTVQVPEAGIGEPVQLFVCEKSPLALMLEKVTGPESLLVKITACGALDVPTG